MALEAEAFREMLEKLKQTCGETLAKSREITTALAQGGAKFDVEKHQSLRKVLKTLDHLLEEEMVPAIQKSHEEVAKKHFRARPGGQRMFPRFNRRLPIRYGHPGNDKMTKGYTHDIGAMGLFIMSHRLEKEGQSLNMEVEVPELGAVMLQGTVIWTKWVPPALRAMEYTGFGIKITNAPEPWFSFFVNRN